jgi:hypothetical protein
MTERERAEKQADDAVERLIAAACRMGLGTFETGELVKATFTPSLVIPRDQHEGEK